MLFVSIIEWGAAERIILHPTFPGAECLLWARVKLQLEGSRMVFEIENECNTYGRWFKFFPVHPKQDTIPRVENKSIKIEIAPPSFFPLTMGHI